MKIGFENEYFVALNGKPIQQVPTDLPHDAAGTLVEARSDAFEDPRVVLASFESRYAELERAVINKGYTLANLAICNKVSSINGGPETAGFHIHFSRPEWLSLGWPSSHHYSTFDHANPPKEIAAMIEQLDGVFKKDYDGVTRNTRHFIWRPKPYGWEYRRLPATVEPGIVAKRLAELYYPQALAPIIKKKKVA